MKKSFFVILAFCTYTFAFADLSNRGRLDYPHGKMEWIIPLVMLLVLGGIFGYFFFKDFWKKNKDEILATLAVFGQGALLLLGIYWLFHFIVPIFVDKSSDTQQNEQTQDNAQQEMAQLPSGSRPVTTEDLVNLEKKITSNSDPWAGYPPVITDGSQMTNKPNDFMLAAILNPSYNLYDFYRAMDMTPQNTQFLSFERYCRSNFIREHYNPSQFRDIYDNVQRAWNIFCGLQGTNFKSPEIVKYMLEYSPYDTSAPRIEDASDPQLIRNLKVKPLYCTGTSSNPRLGIL